jgi:hypothetical protein
MKIMSSIGNRVGSMENTIKESNMLFSGAASVQELPNLHHEISLGELSSEHGSLSRLMVEGPDGILDDSKIKKLLANAHLLKSKERAL